MRVLRGPHRSRPERRRHREGVLRPSGDGRIGRRRRGDLPRQLGRRDRLHTCRHRRRRDADGGISRVQAGDDRHDDGSVVVRHVRQLRMEHPRRGVPPGVGLGGPLLRYARIHRGRRRRERPARRAARHRDHAHWYRSGHDLVAGEREGRREQSGTRHARGQHELRHDGGLPAHGHSVLRQQRAVERHLARASEHTVVHPV